MSNTQQRIIVGAILALIAGAAAAGEYFGLPAVRWLGVVVACMMIIEMAAMMSRNRAALSKTGNVAVCSVFMALLVLMLISIYSIGARPWIILLLLMIIVAADVGAWLFGRMIGGDKMWEKLSANKTWSGQIAGIICGTVAAVLYGLLGTDTFMPQLMWIGIGVALLSQYGDLTASWVKRRMGVKDFGNILPGHGGVIDRFDGWIYVLPIIWLIMM